MCGGLAVCLDQACFVFQSSLDPYAGSPYAARQQAMQQQAALMAAAAAQGGYLTASPVAALAAHAQQVNALAAANGISTATLTPTTGTLHNGKDIQKTQHRFHWLVWFKLTLHVLPAVYRVGAVI